MKITVGGLDEIDPTKERKVFGTNWNLEEDIIVMKMNKIVEFARGLEPTKQNVLRIAAKLFDPTDIPSNGGVQTATTRALPEQV